jgi:hypothetical protein
MLTFRARNIPEAYSENDLKRALWQEFTDEEQVNIVPLTALVPSCRAQSRTQDALLQFHPKTPGFLHAMEKDKTGATERHILINKHVISIDLNFFGLTQVSDPPVDGSVDSE